LIAQSEDYAEVAESTENVPGMKEVEAEDFAAPVEEVETTKEEIK